MPTGFTVERVEPDPEGGPGFVFYAESPGEAYLQIPGSVFEEDGQNFLAAQASPTTDELIYSALPPPADVAFTPEQALAPPGEMPPDVAAVEAPPAPVVTAAPAPVAPPGMVPGAAQITRQVGTPIAPELLAAEDVAQQELVAAVQAEARAGAEASEQQARALETESARIETAERDKRVREEQRRELERSTDAAMERGLRDFMAMREDPDRLWQERGTGARIAAAIGVAMGAFGSGLTGAPNFALQIINAAIDRDLEAQRSDIRRAGFALDVRRSITAAQRAAHQDDRAGDIAAEMSMREAAAKRIDAAGRRADGAQAQAGAATLVARLRQQNVARRTYLIQAAQDRVNMTTTYRPRPTGQARPRTQAPPGYPPDVYANASVAQQTAIWNDHVARQAKDDPANLPVIPGAALTGDPATPPTRAELSGLRNAVSTTDNLVQNLRALRAHREKYGVEYANREAVATGRRMADDVRDKLRQLAGFGVLNMAEIPIIMERVPNPDSQDWVPWADPVLAGYREVERLVTQSTNARLGTFGMRLGERIDPAASAPSTFRPAGAGR